MSLDDLRRRLGIDTGQVSALGQLPTDAPTVGPVECDAVAAHEARRAQWVEETERLHLAGDDADGLEGIRRLFRRAGRG